MPQLDVYRPADAVETAECWALALASEEPSVLALTRQNLPPVRTKAATENLCARGAYRLKAAGSARKVILIATGSEVEIALGVAERLEAQGIGADVVSMPCTERFDAQPLRLSRGHPARRLATARSCASRSRPARPSAGSATPGFTACASASTASASRRRRQDAYDYFGLTPDKVAARVIDYHETKRNINDQSCNQRLRPHRPAGRARDPRAARLRARAGQRSTTSPTPRPMPGCSSATASTASSPAR